MLSVGLRTFLDVPSAAVIQVERSIGDVIWRLPRFVHAIEPGGGPSPDGIARITPAQVTARIEPYLAMTRLA